MESKKTSSRGPMLDTEQCVANVGQNRFDLVLIAAARAREIKQKHAFSDRREDVYPTMTALLEIQEGTIGQEYLKKVR